MPPSSEKNIRRNGFLNACIPLAAVAICCAAFVFPFFVLWISMLLALDVHRIIRVKCLFCVGRFSGFMLNGFLEGFPLPPLPRNVFSLFLMLD